MTSEQSPVKAGVKARLVFFLIMAVLYSVAAGAQETALVTFTLDFPGSEPSHYVISVSSDGHSTYESDGKLSPDSEADPFRLDFMVSTRNAGYGLRSGQAGQLFSGTD